MHRLQLYIINNYVYIQRTKLCINILKCYYWRLVKYWINQDINNWHTLIVNITKTQLCLYFILLESIINQYRESCQFWYPAIICWQILCHQYQLLYSSSSCNLLMHNSISACDNIFMDEVYRTLILFVYGIVLIWNRFELINYNYKIYHLFSDGSSNCTVTACWSIV